MLLLEELHQGYSSTEPLRKPMDEKRRMDAKRTDAQKPQFPAGSSTPLWSKRAFRQQGSSRKPADIVSYRVWSLPVLFRLLPPRIHNAEKEEDACFSVGGTGRGDNVCESLLNKQEHAAKAHNYSRGERDCFQGESVLPEWQTAPDRWSRWRGRRRWARTAAQRADRTAAPERFNPLTAAHQRRCAQSPQTLRKYTFDCIHVWITD